MHKFSLNSILLPFLSVVMFTGCALNLAPSKTKNNEIPKWYLNTLNNTPIYIYGEGSSNSLKEAKINALSTMASKLIVSVSSKIEMSTISNTGDSSSYNKHTNKNIKLEVQKIKFTNAQVAKSTHIGDRFYILMKVNREELFNNNKKEFDINDERIIKKYNNLSQYSKIEQIDILQQMYPDIVKNKSKAIVLNAINNDFDQAPFIQKYDSFIDKIDELKNNFIITVKTNNKHKYFADLLIEELNSKQYKVSSHGDIVIKINNKIKYSMARGWNIAKVSTSLSVVSNDKIVSNKNINSVGRSSTSKESALQSASNAFINKIKKETLDKLIFSK